jgi:hypothetical protein
MEGPCYLPDSNLESCNEFSVYMTFMQHQFYTEFSLPLLASFLPFSLVLESH